MKLSMSRIIIMIVIRFNNSEMKVSNIRRETAHIPAFIFKSSIYAASLGIITKKVNSFTSFTLAIF